MKKVVLFSVWLFLWACKSNQPPVFTGYNYAENLDLYRPKFDSLQFKKIYISEPNSFEPENLTKESQGSLLDVKNKVDSVLSYLMKEPSPTIHRSRFGKGYRIQVYVGRDKSEVDHAKFVLAKNFPYLKLYLSYQQPLFRLKCGDFSQRATASNYVHQIKSFQLFPTVISDDIDYKLVTD